MRKHWKITFYSDITMELQGQPIQVRKIHNETGYCGYYEDALAYAKRNAENRGVEYIIEER